ncbi:solute-binding transport protein, partial [mine drainage metagenome]
YGVPAHAPNPTLGEDFLKVVMSEAGQANSIAAGAMPSTDNVPASYYARLGPIVGQEISFIKKYGGQIGWTSGAPGGLAQQYVDPLVQAMLGGTLTPTQVAAKVQTHFLAFKSGKS